MRALIPTLFTLALVGCASDPPAPSGPGATEDDYTSGRIDAVKIAERSECAAGNGGSSVETFVPASFDPAAVMSALKASNRDRGCGKHKTSTSKEDGVAMFKTFLTEQAETLQASCEDEAAPDAVKKLNADMLKLVEDPTNLGVFSTFPVADSGDDPVSCFFFRFDVYRADGKLVSFDFDWGD